MKLSMDEVKSVLFGAVEIEMEDGGVIFPHKCTKKQWDAWAGTNNENRTIGAQTTTGIRLDFHTDSEYFEVTTVWGNKFSLLLNGEKAEHWFPKCERHTYRVKLPEGENRVTFLFPNHSRGKITDVTLSDGASLIPHTYDSTIMFFGDSITQGWNSAWDCQSFAWRVSLALNADCLINGIGGAVFLPESIDEIPFRPDRIIVAYGTNDFGGFYREYEVFTAACEETLRRIQKLNPQSEIFVLTPIWRADMDVVKPVGTFEQIRQAIADIATNLGMKVIDGFELVPHETKWFADEKVHPNDEGFRLYAENLMERMGNYGK